MSLLLLRIGELKHQKALFPLPRSTKIGLKGDGELDGYEKTVSETVFLQAG